MHLHLSLPHCPGCHKLFVKKPIIFEPVLLLLFFAIGQPANPFSLFHLLDYLWWFGQRFAIAFHTSSILFSGTNILRMAVHFCPAFDVISFLISFIKISHSGISGVTSSPSTMQFNESASILKGTYSLKMCGLDFNINPVVADPVNVITSCEVT